MRDVDRDPAGSSLPDGPGHPDREETTDRSWLVPLLPMVVASGGNAGFQFVTFMIRALTLDETQDEVAWIASRKARIGAVLRGIPAVLGTIVARVMVGHTAARAVAATMLCVVTVQTLADAMLPRHLMQLEWDSTLMFNRLIAPFSGMIEVAIYFNTAETVVRFLS